MKLRAWLTTSLAAALFAACGGATTSDLFVEPASTPSPDRGDGGSVAVGVPDATTTDAEPRTPPPIAEAGKSDDATIDAPSMPEIDAGTPKPVSEIACGTKQCTGATICCRTTDAEGADSFSCTAAQACVGSNTLAIPCDDGKDCGDGNVCCGTFVVDSTGLSYVATSIACAAANDCLSDTKTNLCSPSANECPVNTMCQTGSDLPYKICL